MRTPKGIEQRVSVDARSHPELIPHLILKIVKEKGPITAYGIWRQGPVSKLATVKRYLHAQVYIGSIEERQEEERIVYSITRVGEFYLERVGPLLEDMIHGRSVLSAVDERESLFTVEETMDALGRLIDHLKQKGVINADYQIRPDTSRDTVKLDAQKEDEQALRLTRQGLLRTRKTDVGTET